MMTQPDIDKLIRQTRQYEFSDGLRDLQMAVFFALGGVTVWLSLEPISLVFGLSWSLMLMVSGTIALRRGLMSVQGNR